MLAWIDEYTIRNLNLTWNNWILSIDRINRAIVKTREIEEKSEHSHGNQRYYSAY